MYKGVKHIGKFILTWLGYSSNSGLLSLLSDHQLSPREKKKLEVTGFPPAPPPALYISPQGGKKKGERYLRKTSSPYFTFSKLVQKQLNHLVGKDI